MRHAWLMLLVMIPSCCQETCEAQSIVVSGQRQSIVVSGKTPVQVVPVVEEKKTSPVVSDDTHHEPVHRTAGEVPSRRYLAMFTARYCGPCQDWKATVLKQLLALGYHVEIIEMTDPANAAKYGSKIGSYPTFVVCDWTTGKWLTDTISGKISLETAKDMLNISTQYQPAQMVVSSADQPSNYTEAQRQADIEHLLTHRSHAGKFTREYLETLSGYQLIDLHNTDHGVPTRKGQKIGVSVSPAVSQPNRYIQWPGWGEIDLETYNRNCNCSMCRSIRQKQAEYWRQKAQTAVSPDQEGCPHEVVEEMLDHMQLRPDDVLGDLGCGDGRILVAAARRGIRGIGIELDPVRSDIARKNVAAAGVSHLVTIETGDALEFDFGRITAATAYLYPPLLEKLSPRLSGLRVVASPFHEIPGLRMTQAGDVWIASKG